MQDYQQRVTVATADGIELELDLAGLGSRFIAGSVDLAIKAVVIGLAGFGLAQLGDVGVILIIPLTLGVYFGYDVLFEMLAAGRTPGKRWSSLRVLRLDGRPVDLASSAVRNVLRLVDGLLLAYLPGMISITLTKRQQRLGDLAAGTIVVRERRESIEAPVRSYGDHTGSGVDTTRLSDQELAAVRSFIDRRATLGPFARTELAEQLVAGIEGRVGGAATGLSAERFLERVAGSRGVGTGGPGPAGAEDPAGRIDATGLTEQDLGTVRSFLERRYTLDPAVRARLAERLAAGIADRVGGDTAGLTPEQFLERVARARARGAGR